MAGFKVFVMELKGNFEASSLASILQMLHNDSKTGELRFQEGGNEVIIFLKEGDVVFAQATHQDSRLGSLLRSKGIISAAQLQECLDESKKTKEALGKTLVSFGYITEDTLKKVLCKQAKDVIYSVFLWTKGSFVYNDSKSIDPGLLVTKLDIMSIILEATRRLDEMSVIRGNIPDDTCVFRMTDKLKNKKQLKFSPVEWRFISLIDGTRNVRKLIQESGYDTFSVYRVLNTLLSSGLVELASGAVIGDTRLDAGYSAIISIYVDVLQETCRQIKAELGSWPYTVIAPRDRRIVLAKRQNLRELHEKQLSKWVSGIIDSCKPVITPEDADFFKTFKADTPADVYMHVVLECIRDIEDVEEGRTFLVRHFDDFLEKLLGKLPETIGPGPAKRALSDIGNIPRYVRKYQKGLAEKTDAILRIENLIQTLSSNIEDEPEEKQSIASVFGIFLED